MSCSVAAEHKSRHNEVWGGFVHFACHKQVKISCDLKNNAKNSWENMSNIEKKNVQMTSLKVYQLCQQINEFE